MTDQELDRALASALDVEPRADFQARVRRECPSLMVSGVTGTVTFSAGIGERDEPAVTGWSCLVLRVNSAYDKLHAQTLEGLADAVVAWWRGVKET